MSGKLLLLIALSVALTGCASSYNLSAGERAPWGGGVATRLVKPGLYYVKVQTNAGPVPNYGSAQSMWNEQAALACKGVEYSETMIDSYDYDFVPAFLGLIPYKIVSRSGYCICTDHKLSEQELTALYDRSFQE